MLTISKPLSAGQAARYHAEEFRNARENYYSTGNEILGRWHGQLAQKWDLVGDVDETHFERLANGRHPVTDEALVRHQTAHLTTNARGQSVKTMEHRAGWDATFSAPKSVSLTALVGGDTRVRDAHRESVAVALDETERYVQARLGGWRAPEATGNWVAATFEHDSARPVSGYSAPQLHTHALFFNLTETESGDVRPIQPKEVYRTQQYATAVYRSELATRVTALGYEVERGAHGQPEIRGYTPEYLEASSPRSRQIQEYLAREQQQGAAAAQIAAHRTREPKLDIGHDEMQRRHQIMAAAFNYQPTRVVEAAHAHAPARVLDPHAPNLDPHTAALDSRPVVINAASAVTYGRDRNFEREAVVHERDVLRDALTRSMGDVTFTHVKTEFEQRVEAGDFIRAEQRPGTPGRSFTTPELIELERDTIERIRAGQRTQPSLAPAHVREAVLADYGHLSETQRAAVERILASRDQVQALEGVAGAGKTTALTAVRDAAERAGYEVKGFAPTSRAAHQLGEAGVESTTLQRHLAREGADTAGRKHLYVLDESSLASTRHMHAFVERLDANDRILLVGDVRQHQAVEAGRPYQQLQEAGIEVARLDDIVRQKDPTLKAVVESLASGHIREAVDQLEAQRRVHEFPDREQRIEAIARAYVQQPKGTLVVSPDNPSRLEINEVIHRALQTSGEVALEEHRLRVLVPRQEITGADRQWAERYEPGDAVRYTCGSLTHGLDAREYARVDRVNAKENLVTVERASGEQVTYDPRRLHGVTVYRETDRAFAVGDRIQFTAPDPDRHIANRELGTVERIEKVARIDRTANARTRGRTQAISPADGASQVRLRLDSGRSITLRSDRPLHLDYGYAVTSHSSQGQTADRVLVHIDTDRGGEYLVNRRMAYVAISRGRYDAQIYTNDASRLGPTLGRDVSHRSAIDSAYGADPTGHSRDRATPVNRTPQLTIGGPS
jgi:conjugative relaxase-like TrwC/TraI family protein